MPEKDLNEDIDVEKESRVNALQQLVSVTSDEFSAAKYAAMSGLTMPELYEKRREWLDELQELTEIEVPEPAEPGGGDSTTGVYSAQQLRDFTEGQMEAMDNG